MKSHQLAHQLIDRLTRIRCTPRREAIASIATEPRRAGRIRELTGLREAGIQVIENEYEMQLQMTAPGDASDAPSDDDPWSRSAGRILGRVTGWARRGIDRAGAGLADLAATGRAVVTTADARNAAVLANVRRLGELVHQHDHDRQRLAKSDEFWALIEVLAVEPTVITPAADEATRPDDDEGQE